MSEPWYRDGLRFSCTRCGDCCTGEPGYVWVNDGELAELARFLNMPLDELTGLHTRLTRGGRTLREKADGACIYWDADRGCTVYPVRPRQCRTWPFWESNISSPEAWEETKRICPGSGQGELIPAEEITRRLKVIKL